jgi:hypothetical protein
MLKIKIYLACFATFFLWANAYSQCISGNCDNGWGKMKDEKGRVYQGHFLNNQKHGKGTFTYSNGDKYEGNWANGLQNGYGIRFFPNGKAQGGIWEKGKLIKPDANIQVVMECISGDCKNGEGKSRDAKGRVYKGQFKNNAYEGYGILTYPSGDIFKGMFVRGLPDGGGSYYYQNGHTDTGDWEQGRLKGGKIRIWALIVGVAEYPNYQPLTYTTEDAKKIYAFFRSPEGGAVPENQIKLLTNKQATSINIQNEMADLFEKADTNDLIIFYYAGHGIEGAFVPYDSDGKKENLLSHAVVNTLLSDSPAKFKFCIADACHSGSYSLSYNDYKANGYKMGEAASRSNADARDKIKEFYNSFANVKGGLAVMMSSAAEEVSLEATKLKQGVFSYFFIQGMRGNADENENGIVTVTELHNYINSQVQSFTFKYQNPNMFGDYDKNMPVGLVTKKK